MRATLPSGTEVEIVVARNAPPPGEGGRMGLVVATDIFGLRPLFDEICTRLSTQWWMTVCAVEPFPGMRLGTDLDERMAAVHRLDDAATLRDLVHAADLTGCARVGLVGFCMGGMSALRATSTGRFDRIVSFYGMIRVPQQWHSPTQREPLELIADGDASRVLAFCGGRDHWTPPEDVAALAASGVTVVEYPEGEHGFAHDAARPAHRADDAADAFGRARAWLMG